MRGQWERNSLKIECLNLYRVSGEGEWGLIPLWGGGYRSFLEQPNNEKLMNHDVYS